MIKRLSKIAGLCLTCGLCGQGITGRERKTGSQCAGVSMKALILLAWIVRRPFISNIAGDFVNDFTKKSLSGGRLSSGDYHLTLFFACVAGLQDLLR